MTSRQHQDWINHGKPDSGLALPLQLLANTLAAAGYTVYVYPNDAHLDAEPPEDHTFYSETGWPGTSPKWWRHAIDIMPSHGGADLYALGQRIVADRNAGQAQWIKYINVPTDASLRGALQHSWKPGHSVRTSSDTGHIHISSVTGCETLDDSYNPLTSVVVVVTPPTPIPPAAEELPVFAAHDSQGEIYLCDGVRSRQVPFPARGDVVTLINEGLIKLVNDFGNSRGGWYEGAFGALEAAPTFTAAITDAQVSALAADVVAGLAALAPAAQLTASDVAAELARRLQA